MADKKLFLFDAFAMIYRAHFAFSKNPRINSKGFNTGAILGFTNTMIEVIRKEKPTHMAVCFDMPGPTFRHEEFTEYKANREEQPEDITLSLPIIRDLIESYNIKILQAPGYEADDVVGTVAKMASKEGFEVYMLTSDKDYAQLVEDNIFMYKPNFLGKGYETLGVPEVLEKWDIERVDQVIDILGLQGDAVDNIPGIPGIGKKTAVKLLKEYGSVEGIIENSDKLKGKQQQNVIEFAEQGILSKHLATIITDVPVDVKPDELIFNGPDEEKVSAIFDEMEFRTLKQRVFGKGDEKPAAKPKKAAASSGQMDMFGAAATSNSTTEEVEEVPVEKQTVASTKHLYHLIDTEEDIKNLIKYLNLQDEFCFDSETTGLDTMEAEVVGLSFCYLKGEAYYVPVPVDQAEAKKRLSLFKQVFANDKIQKIGQNLKYDIEVLQKYDIEVKGPLFDTMLAHYLLEPDQRHSMDILAENYLNYTPISIETLIGKKGKKQGNMRDLEPRDVLDYAAEDADITFQLKEIFEPQLKEMGQLDLLMNVESKLIDVLAAMEHNGVCIDSEALAELSKGLAADSLKEQEKIFELAGEEFNIASPKQLGLILFEKLALDPKAKKTKTGQYATGEEILSKLAKEHEIASSILNFREYQKLKSTYVDALPKMVSTIDNRIHTDYRQAVAATGRLSSNNPNLQNIPIRTERGREVRKAFIPAEGNILFSADYSQIELRIMAAFSQDESMVTAFKNGIDIHSTTAAKVFGVPLEDVESSMRRKAKEVNFGLIYGISAFGLANNLGISRGEAKEIVDSYWEQFPAIKEYMDKAVNEARENEFVETILGRRRYLRDINSRNHTVRGFAERNAINAPIQGSAADMIKVAMINIHDWMLKERLQSKMILQVHDELVFDVVKEELDIISEKVPDFMKNAIEFAVPLEVEYGTGVNWLEAH